MILNKLEMNSIVVKALFFAFFILIISELSAQDNSRDRLIQGDLKKIERADKKIEKAESIVKKKEKYSSQLQQLEENGRIRKSERIKTKANQIVIKSASYFKDGYGNKYKAYKRAVGRELKNGNLDAEAEKLLGMAGRAYKTGRKWRRKSGGQADVNKGVEYLFKANREEEDAIKSLIRAIEVVSIVPENQTEEIEPDQDSIVEIVDTLAAIASPVETGLVADSVVVHDSIMSDSLMVNNQDTILEAIVPVAEEIIQGSETVQPDLSTYFSIQFLAEKQPVPKEKITNIYGGTYEVIKHEGDGWYRYSFGKFASIEEAKGALSQSGVSGYVVAYHNDKRISTREAIELMSTK